MTDLDALLAGIVAHPHEHIRWLVMADWLEDHGFPERAELIRVHRELLRTCTEPDSHPDRPQLHARMMELMRAGVQPCLPQKTLTLPGGVEMRMSFIPPGAFLMGSPETEAERGEEETLHLVTLTQAVWMGQSPVTQAQWEAVACENHSKFKDDELPVENVSWDDTLRFFIAIKEHTGIVARLPSEAEWEFAARSGTTTPFFWGSELNGTQANCYGHFSYGPTTGSQYRGKTSEVGCYAEVSPHPWCLKDVSGNVYEWCGDWFGLFSGGEAKDPIGSENGTRRVIRGGNWSGVAGGCRTACRGKAVPDGRGDGLGVRLAADGSAFD